MVGDVSGPARMSQANLVLAEKNRSALSLSSVRGRGVSCLWIWLLVFITSSCAGTEGRHTIPYPALSLSGLSHLCHSSLSMILPEHWRESWKNTQDFLPHIPTDQWGLSLSENGSARLCETVLMYQEPRQVSTLLTLNMQIRNTTLHLSVIDLNQKRAKRRRLTSVCSN